MVVDVDSPERIDGGEFLGRQDITLADGQVVEVPRGASYQGPPCMFEETSFEVDECLIHAGYMDGQIDWVSGFRIEEDGRITPGFDTGDLVAVDVDSRYVITKWGGTFVWEETPAVECPLFEINGLDDPALIEHGAWLYSFNSDGYLTRMGCGIEG